jgi:ATP-dependent helicase HepA
MAGTSTSAQEVLEVGCFVRVSGDGSVGRLASIEADEAIVRYFKGPQEAPFEDLIVSLADVAPYVPPINTRVFFVDGGIWRVGRIDSIPTDGETDFIVALPNSTGAVLDPASFDVRWGRPIDDPFLFLKAGGTESPWLFDQRSLLLAGMERQRTTARGAEGLLASSVEIHAHQFVAVRTAGSGDRCRYLLADEVGMGKTIEACALIRQRVGVDSSTLVVVPEHLVEQWRAELSAKFHLDESPESLTIVSSDRPQEWPMKAPAMLVVDEAHHFTRTGGATGQAQNQLAELAGSATHLLLLSATPVRSNEAGFLDMLAMLDPGIYDAADVEGFTQRVQERDRLARIARSLESLDDQFEFSFLSSQLEDLFPSDATLSVLIGTAQDCSPADFDRSIARVRSHLSTVYRLDHRVLRTRRGGLSGGVFAVRGRTRGRPFTLEVDDATGGLRSDLLEFVRTQLAVALDKKTIDQPYAVATFAEFAGRCSSLPVALDPSKIPASIMEVLSGLLADEETEEFHGLLVAIVQRSDRLIESFVQELSNLVAVRDVGRVVIASAFNETIVMASALMVEKWGKHRSALHSVGQSSADNSAAVERWETDPVCSLLFVDAGAEEGINLQAADLLVHLDLPWSTNRIEQRVGRCDRYDGDRRGAIPSVVVSYGESPYGAAWFEFEADAASVFNRSVSALQYALATIEQRLVLDVIEAGPDVLLDAIELLRVELEEAESTIEAHDALDSVDVAVDVAALLEADSDEHFPEALVDWLAGVGCRARQVRPGVVSFRCKGRPQVPRSLEVVINRYSDVPLALSRQASVRGGEELLRAGHPLVDAIGDYLRTSDRGAAFVMQRHATSTWPPVPVTRSELLVSVNDQLLGSMATGAALALLRDLCAEFLPMQHESVFVLPDGRDASHPSITRPYDKANGDLNLGSRPELRAQLIGLVDWDELCSAGRELATRIVRERIATRSERVDAVEEVVERVVLGLDQLRLRSSLDERSEVIGVHSVDLSVLRKVLSEPQIQVVGAGVILLCDSTRFGTDV